MRRFFLAPALMTVLVCAAAAGPAEDAYESARSLIEQGDFRQAAEITTAALASEPDNFKLNLLAGEIYSALNDHEKALSFYQAALAKKKKDPDALLGAGNSSFNLGRYQEAAVFFEMGIKTGKKKGDFLYSLGRAQMEMGNYAEADLNVRKAIDREKNRPEYHLALGEVNYRNKVFSIAVSEFTKAMELDPTLEKTVTDLHYKLAQSYLNMRNVQKTIEEYRKHLALFHGDTTAWLDFARIYEASENRSEAAFCYEKYLNIVPDNGEVWYKLGLIDYSALRQLDKAAEAFEKAVSLDSHAAESYGFLATIYADRGEYEKAVGAYSRYEAAFGAPDSALYWFDKGKTEMKLGAKNTVYFDSALAAFQKASKIDSTFSSAYEYAGLAMYSKKNYAGAIPFFKRKIALDSSSVNSYRNLAFSYLKLEAYDDAAAAFSGALDLKPDDVQMRSMLGKIYTFNKNYEKSIRQYELLLNDYSGLLNDSLRCEVYPDLGLSYLSINKCQEAIPVLSKADRCKPRDVSILFNLGSAYELCNWIKEANAKYREVLELDPGNVEAKKGVMRTTLQGHE